MSGVFALFGVIGQLPIYTRAAVIQLIAFDSQES
jgi:hypothetical protein